MLYGMLRIRFFIISDPVDHKQMYYFNSSHMYPILIVVDAVTLRKSAAWNRNEEELVMRAIDMSPPMLATIDEFASLIDAAKMMRAKGVGDIIVTRISGGAALPVGVVTDRDIVVHAVACDLNPEKITVADLCTREPATVDADADLTEIAAAMNKHGVRRLLVTRDSEIAGVISLDNVIDAMAEIMTNLGETLAHQIDYEQEHFVPAKSQENAA